MGCSNFNYPKSIVPASLNLIVGHRNGRHFSDRVFFVKVRLSAWLSKFFLGRASFVSAYYTEDYEVAYKLALASAERHAVAASLVAHMLLHGIGCEQSVEQGMHWTRVAAEKGEPVAMCRHAHTIKNSDPKLAYQLFVDSFAAGQEYAAIGLLALVLLDETLVTADYLSVKDEVLNVVTGAASSGFKPAQEVLDRLAATR
jgi:hypothetical protein